jgi:hypothetical protein
MLESQREQLEHKIETSSQSKTEDEKNLLSAQDKISRLKYELRDTRSSLSASQTTGTSISTDQIYNSIAIQSERDLSELASEKLYNDFISLEINEDIQNDKDGSDLKIRILNIELQKLRELVKTKDTELLEFAKKLKKSVFDSQSEPLSKSRSQLTTPFPQTPRTPALTSSVSSSHLISNTKFFVSINQCDSSRDYVIIVDKSSSMKVSDRWKQAEEAVKILAQKACECDTDGITLYFFSSHRKTSQGDFPAFNKYSNVISPEEVMRLFSLKENEPKGSTDLTRVLKDAFESFLVSENIKNIKPITLLVITDGAPDDKQSVETLLIETANKLITGKEISITIVQIGDCKQADAYLNELDNGLEKLGARFDIVDVLSHQDINTTDLTSIIGQTILPIKLEMDKSPVKLFPSAKKNKITSYIRPLETVYFFSKLKFFIIFISMIYIF